MPSDPKHVSGPGAAAQQRFLSLFLRSEREAFRYVAALVPNVADAEDIVQQTALARWEKFDAFDPAQPFTPSRVTDANLIGCQTTAGRWPGASATIPALASGKHEKVCGVRLLGHDGTLEFTQDQSGFRVQLPAERPGDHAFALEIIEPEWPKASFANPTAKRGISGPGHALSPNAPLPVHRRPTVNSAVREGRLLLIPPLLIPPLLNLHLRDTVICLGGDGNYYLTGSSGDDIWDFNDGVELWCSTDLQRWEYLGVVWTLAQNAIWEKDLRDLHGKPTVTIWVPEIRYLKQLNTCAIVLSMAPGGISILKSTTGKPLGPYVNPVPGGKPLRSGGIDATLFEDHYGKVYFVSGAGGTISLMKVDPSGFSETRKTELLNPDLTSAHHAPKVVQRGMKGFAHAGVVLFKANGKYYHGAVNDYAGRYSNRVAVADSIWGPYDKWHETVPCGGGTNFFQDKEGCCWCAFSGNDDAAPWRELPSIVRVEFAANGKIHVAKQPPFVEDPKWN